MKNIFKYLTVASTCILISGNIDAQNPRRTDETDYSPIKTTKSRVSNGDGTYTITLDSFVTGELSNETKRITTNAPLDIVLVLDVSGSMDKDISSQSTESYVPRSSQGYTYNDNPTSYYYKHTDGKYYKVNRDTASGEVSYTARSSQGYTPGNINNGNFYYKHTDGKYYLVKRGGNFNNSRYLYITVGSDTYYLHGTSVNTTSQTYNNNTVAYTGVLYDKTTTTYYRLYVTINNVKYYLSGTGITTTAPTDVTASNGKIWTGVLYEHYTVSSKMDALKVACKTFIHTIDSTSTADCTHRIAIVKFAGDNRNTVGNDTYSSGWNTYNYTQIVTNLTSDWSGLNTAIDALNPGGATSADYGMAHAKTIINGITGDRAGEVRIDPDTKKTLGSIKVVVMFTDGEPNHGNNFDGTVAATTVNAAKDMKDAGVKIYTVGVFPSTVDTSDGSEVGDYMNGTSSNYPDATARNNNWSNLNLGTRATDDQGNNREFFLLASTASQLNSVFATISGDVADASSHTGSDIELESTEVTIRDIITPQFCIPEGGSVSLWVADIEDIEYDETTGVISNYIWGELEEAPAEVQLLNDGSGADKTVDVTGYDFSSHWVGFTTVRHDGVEDISARAVYEPGQKLVIKILVAPDPDSEGGYSSTNTEKSGFYIGDIQTTIEPAIQYEDPGSVYTPMDMKISKSGLKAGESALFKIYKGSGDSKEYIMTVALTAGADGTATSTIAKLDIVEYTTDAEGRITGSTPIIYTVEEDTTWTYSTVSVAPNVISHALYSWRTGTESSDPDNFILTNEFNYGTGGDRLWFNDFNGNGDASKKENTNPKAYHDENAKNNVFKRVVGEN